ncbi:hypothetical protein SELMODRAFT_430052 [Selaginella moellendorffii]|uniref:Uncharacterized protein n=1 Tax=Selaginella moellendorffii TaxID=88036 RepID=D8T863_SELML|nr:hypothetical protein SELMODRAFT_430052 [Selaginella moellendorffii]
MKNVEVSKETKKKFLQALQRQSEERKESINDEEEETFISDETLHKLIAGAEVIVADLSLDELKAFQRAVASGELCHLIEPWEPCYCFVMRLYNGEWKDSPLDAAMDLLATSKVLSQSAQPETVTEVIWCCSEAVCSPAFRHAGGSQLSLLLCDDTAAVLRIGRPAVVRALADLQRMLEASIDESKKLKMVDTKKESKLIQAASRKAFFLMCWANQLGDGVACFAALVDTEKERRAEPLSRRWRRRRQRRGRRPKQSCLPLAIECYSKLGHCPKFHQVHRKEATKSSLPRSRFMHPCGKW